MSPKRTVLVLAFAALALVASSCDRSVAPPKADAPQAAAEPVAAPGMPPSTAPDQLPPGHPPIAGKGSMDTGGLVPPEPGAGSGETGMTWTVPAGWTSETPSFPTRKAQYRIEGPGGAAECYVSYFGPGQGGDAASNVERWASQFSSPDGKGAAERKTSTREVGNLQVLTVEVRGTYVVSSMMGPPGPPKPGYMLLGAIAEGPDANWFFKLTGPEKTVESQRVGFDTMLGSLRKGA